jgi:hypothetical protein
MDKMTLRLQAVPDPDRVLDCEFYLEPAVVDIVDLALEAGWSGDEIEAALLSLARHRVLARIEQEPKPLRRRSGIRRCPSRLAGWPCSSLEQS